MNNKERIKIAGLLGGHFGDLPLGLYESFCELDDGLKRELEIELEVYQDDLRVADRRSEILTERFGDSNWACLRACTREIASEAWKQAHIEVWGFPPSD